MDGARRDRHRGGDRRQCAGAAPAEVSRLSCAGVNLDVRASWENQPGWIAGFLLLRSGRAMTKGYSAARAASDRLSSEEMTCSASASASELRSCGLRTSPMRQEDSSGKPSAAESTRMPGRSPDSG